MTSVVTAHSFIDVLAEMHTHDPDSIGVGDIARKDGYIARQLKRWYSQWNASKTRELALVDDVHDELSKRIPEQGPARVVHGDYRLGNCISGSPNGPSGAKIAAVLDWEIATLGDPLADVGYDGRRVPDARGTRRTLRRCVRTGPLADRVLRRLLALEECVYRRRRVRAVPQRCARHVRSERRRVQDLR